MLRTRLDSAKDGKAHPGSSWLSPIARRRPGSILRVTRTEARHAVENSIPSRSGRHGRARRLGRRAGPLRPDDQHGRDHRWKLWTPANRGSDIAGSHRMACRAERDLVAPPAPTSRVAGFRLGPIARGRPNGGRDNAYRCRPRPDRLKNDFDTERSVIHRPPSRAYCVSTV